VASPCCATSTSATTGWRGFSSDDSIFDVLSDLEIHKHALDLSDDECAKVLREMNHRQARAIWQRAATAKCGQVGAACATRSQQRSLRRIRMTYTPSAYTQKHDGKWWLF
jgi:hypothetical protein